MDAARYMAPALQNFAKMIIPLSEPVPRRLGTYFLNWATKPANGD